MAVYHDLDWLFAIGTIFFLISVWGIGANDVANSYATSVSSRSLTLIQAGILATITEFIGAIALGQQVTSTIRSGVFSIHRFLDSPGVLIMAMVVAEVGSSIWLTVCTYFGFPVSTTQSIVGALIGVAIASDLPVTWGWKSQSVSQIAASWGIAPVISAAFGAIIFTSIRLLVHSREDPMKWALRVLPFYYALTAGILALFIVISGGHGIPKPEDLGAGKACGIIIGVFAGVWVISAVFFVPYYWRSLVKEDRRLRFWHIPMGPLLWRDNYTLYFPGNPDKGIVPDYYESDLKVADEKGDTDTLGSVTEGQQSTLASPEIEPIKGDANTAENEAKQADAKLAEKHQKELQALDSLPWAHPKRLYATLKLVFTYGITRDVIHHQSKGLEDIHRRAPQFDNKVEHLWTTAQVCSAMIMSISHGANDISNAIGPFTTEYMTWHTGVASAKTDTPIWIKAVGGLGLGVGFWTFGYHIMRSLGNRITKHSPTRGYSMELGAAITVLLASRLGLPVSTTQCITGAVLGVALVNMDLKSINWKQLAKIFLGWVLTLPCAGLISGIIMGMALNVPQWGRLIDNNRNNISSFGIRGKLCVRGPTITPGYYQNASADADAFDAEGWFKIGDVTYCDGRTRKWYIVHRKKELIKVRGFQVAPPELEAVLLGHPLIVDAAVIGVVFPWGDTECPRAYVVRRPGMEGDNPTEEEVRKYLGERLARYKALTGGVKFVDTIAKNPSGKILKRVLGEDSKRDIEAALRPKL